MGETYAEKRERLQKEAAEKKARKEYQAKNRTVTDPTKTVPKEMMPFANRHQRRYMAKLSRTEESRARIERVRKHIYQQSLKRRDAHEARLDRVRARTKARKGVINNPRFR